MEHITKSSHLFQRLFFKRGGEKKTKYANDFCTSMLFLKFFILSFIPFAHCVLKINSHIVADWHHVLTPQPAITQ